MQKNNLDQYNTYADQWWTERGPFRALYHLNPPRFVFFDQFIGTWSGLKALDIGCGGGYASEFMAKRGAQVTGIDLSEQSIAAARQHAQEAGLEIDYLVARAESLPFADQSFDVALCVDVLEHVPDVGKAIREAHRILKPGGHLLFDTINRNFISRVAMIWLMERLLGEIPRGTHDWNMFIRPEELRRMTDQAGFKDFVIQGFGMRGKDRKTGVLDVKLTRNTSIMYVGKVRKPTDSG